MDAPFTSRRISTEPLPRLQLRAATPPSLSPPQCFPCCGRIATPYGGKTTCVTSFFSSSEFIPRGNFTSWLFLLKLISTNTLGRPSRPPTHFDSIRPRTNTLNSTAISARLPRSANTFASADSSLETTEQLAEKFSFCHSERSLRREESFFSWVFDKKSSSRCSEWPVRPLFPQPTMA